MIYWTAARRLADARSDRNRHRERCRLLAERCQQRCALALALLTRSATFRVRTNDYTRCTGELHHGKFKAAAATAAGHTSAR